MSCFLYMHLSREKMCFFRTWRNLLLKESNGECFWITLQFVSFAELVKVTFFHWNLEVIQFDMILLFCLYSLSFHNFLKAKMFIKIPFMFVWNLFVNFRETYSVYNFTFLIKEIYSTAALNENPDLQNYKKIWLYLQLTPIFESNRLSQKN